MKRLFFVSILLFSLGGALQAQDLAEAWTPLNPENDAHVRHESAFVQAGDQYYLVGGRGLKPVDVYDPQTNTWTEGKVPPIEFHHFQAVTYQGLVYVLGALTGPYPFEVPIPNIFIYDPVQDLWMVGPEIPVHRRRGAAGVVVYQDKIYLVCGIVNGHRSHWVPWLDEFDPATNTWRELPDAPRARDHFQAAVIDGKLYAAGGRRSGAAQDPFSSTIAEVDVFDFSTETWSTLPSPAGDLPTQRAGTAVAVLGNDLLVLGGESGSQELAHEEVEALDVTSGTWRSLPPLHTGRHGTQAITNPHGIFVVGGCARRGGSPELTALETLRRTSEAEGSSGAPVEPGTLTLQSVESLASDSLQATLTNEGGNQALVIAHAIAIGTGRVHAPHGFPYILAPGAALDLTVAFDSEAEDPGSLLVKTFQQGDPVTVALQSNE